MKLSSGPKNKKINLVTGSHKLWKIVRKFSFGLEDPSKIREIDIETKDDLK